MNPRLSAGMRDWPLPAKVIAALTCALLPLGVLATVLTADAFQQMIAGTGESSVQHWIGVALPLLMWLAALLIGWLVANRLLVKPLLQMRRALELYGQGNTDIRLGDTDFFSQEMTALASAFDKMADDIGSHDVAMNEALAEQKRLTREVHHRVKNNLQIVSSLLSIQARESSSTEVARAYALVQVRVGALALVHRWMYDDETARGVDLHALATDLCASLEQNTAASGHLPMQLRCSVDRFFVGQDTAVPLAFLITELVNLAANRAAPNALEASVTAHAKDGRAVLTICAPPFTDAEGLGTADPAARIIQGMARQLRSPLVHNAIEGCYSVEFSVPARTGT